MVPIVKEREFCTVSWLVFHHTSNLPTQALTGHTNRLAPSARISLLFSKTDAALALDMELGNYLSPDRLSPLPLLEIIVFALCYPRSPISTTS